MPHRAYLFGVVLATLAGVTLLVLESLDLADPVYDALYNQAFNGASGSILLGMQLMLQPFLPSEEPKPLLEIVRSRERPRGWVEVTWACNFLLVVTWSSVAQAIAGVARGNPIALLIRLLIWIAFCLVGVVSLLLWRWWRAYYTSATTVKRLAACGICLGFQCLMAANGFVCQRNYGDEGCRSLVAILSGLSFAALAILILYICSAVPVEQSWQMPRIIGCSSKSGVAATTLLLLTLGIVYTLDAVDVLVGFSASATPAMLTLMVILQIRISMIGQAEAADEDKEVGKEVLASYTGDLYNTKDAGRTGLTPGEKFWIFYYAVLLVWMVAIGVLYDFKGKVPLEPVGMVFIVITAIGVFGVGLFISWRKWGPELRRREDSLSWTIIGFVVAIVQLIHGTPLYLCEAANGKNPCQRLQVIGEAVNFGLFLLYFAALRLSHSTSKSAKVKPQYAARAALCLKVHACFFFLLGLAAAVTVSFFYISDANFVYCPSAADWAAAMADLRSKDAVAFELIMQAGTTHSDSNRTQLLRALQAHLGEGSTLRKDVDTLLPVADLWSDGQSFVSPVEDTLGESGYLVGWFVFEVWPSFISSVFGRPLFPPPMSSPLSGLHPIWAMYRGRMMIANGVENGFLTEFYFPRGRDFIQCASQAFPQNLVLRQYLGESMEWPANDVFPGDVDTAGAPDWAVLQRGMIERLVNVLDFWISERQLANGEFGGGWNDDVEIWRWGSAILLGFEEGFALEYQAAQRKLSEGIFALDRMKDGFTAFITDVEHTAEDTADSIIPMLLLYPGEEIWKQRALKLTELMQTLWTANNTDGDLVYKSNYFASKAVDNRPEVACDIPKNVRAITPALVLWQSDPAAYPEITSIVSRWMDTWVRKTASSDCGKPAGVVPASIHFPDGRTGGPATDDWFLPGCKTACLEFAGDQEFCADDVDAFAWPSSVPDVAQTLMLTALATGDHCKYLYPVRSMADIRRRFLAGDLDKTKKEGTLGWAGRKLRSSFIESLAKLKLLVNTTEFDDLLPSANGYARFYMTGDLSELEKELRESVVAYSVNYEQYTSEVRFTDRIRKFHDNYWNAFFDTVAPEFKDNPAWPPLNISLEDFTDVPGLNEISIYQMVTGDLGSPVLIPLPAVRWQTAPRAFAALVSDNSVDSFEAQLFHFQDSPRVMGAKMLRLAPGEYQWNLTCASTSSAGTFTNVNISTFDFVLPSKELCVLNVAATTPVNMVTLDENCPTIDEFTQMLQQEKKECPVEVPERLPVLLITIPEALQFGLLGLLGVVLILTLISTVLFQVYYSRKS